MKGLWGPYVRCAGWMPTSQNFQSISLLYRVKQTESPVLKLSTGHRISTRHCARHFANIIPNPYSRPIKAMIPYFTDGKTKTPGEKMTYPSHTADESRGQDSFYR